ncbi:MAG: peptide chain release factor 2 [Oscillospiraceae bacterium]|jgi:peptide chain release factor 2|nr:peptide chain release factor 2 [Oscillospiraceae bacterium]
MLIYEELKLNLLGMKPKLDALKVSMACDRLGEELADLEGQSAAPDFWENMANSQKTLQRMKEIKNRLDAYKTVYEKYIDAETMIDIANEEKDETLFDETKEAVKAFSDELESQTLATLLTGEYDANNAILSFHAGAGGTEAQDWVQMLYRMYTMWAERHKYKYKILDYLDGDEAGIKSASILIEGRNAYGFLRSETGVHRLVRISPFDSSGRRHTSFASVETMPEIEDDNSIEINPEDLKVDTFRSSGAGGQHVNKTESAIRITHVPTGIVVSCQTERSQHQNRDTAMKMLRSKLAEIKEREHLEKIDDIKGEHREIAWGSQIRSYVFMPYTLAKDHRTNYETGNISAVMDGDLDGFINAYLQAKSNGDLK